MNTIAPQNKQQYYSRKLNDNNIEKIQEVMELLKPGDIIVAEPAHYSKFRLKDWVARGSRVIQNTRWGHTGLYDGNGIVLEARVDVLIGPGKLFDGMTCRSMDKYIIEQNFLIARPIACEQAKYDAIEKMREFLGKGYIKYDKFRFFVGGLDLMGIKFMGKRDFEESHRAICSEVIAKAYVDSVDFVKGRHYSQILPTHILYSNMVEHIAVVERNKFGEIRIRKLYNNYSSSREII